MQVLKERPHKPASALTVRATHDASAAHQVQQGQQAVSSTTSSAIVKGCGPYTEQAEGAGMSTLIKAGWSGQAAAQWDGSALEAMPLLRATSEAGSVGRDSLDSLRRSSTSSGSSRSSLDLAVFVNAQSGAHPRGGSGQLLQLPSVAALLSSAAAVHRHHDSEVSPGDGSPAGATGISGDAAAVHNAPGARSIGPGSTPAQVSCLCAAGPLAAVEPHRATGRLSWPQCSNCCLVLIWHVQLCRLLMPDSMA